MDGNTVDLSILDEPRPARVDGAIWERNLVALAEENASFADALRATALPPTWRPVYSVDDALTFRLEAEGHEPAWLGDTAAPRARAAAVLANAGASNHNVGLATVGAGSELALLLARLPAHVAVYVFEQDVRRLAAVLRLYDLADAIRAGRCILVPADREQQYLAELLGRHAGLLPPASLLATDQVTANRREELRQLCQRAYVEIGQQRSREIERLRAAPAEPRPSATPRLMAVVLKPEPLPHAVAHELVTAAGTLGWPAECSVLTGPRTAHPLFHCERLMGFAPTVTMFLGQMPDALPIRAPGRTCVWHPSAEGVPSKLPADETLHLAASPRVVAALRAAGVSADAIRPWYWACADLPAGEPHEDQRARERDRPLLLVGDLPALEPEPHGITQDTHQILWKALVRLASELWPTPLVLEPAKMLARAEGQCGVRIQDEVLRDALVKLVERVVVPGVVLEVIVGALVKTESPVLTLGHGWQRLQHPRLRCAAADIFSLPPCDSSPPRACVFAGQADPLGPALLYAAARAWPLIVHVPGGRVARESWGDVLRPGEHFEPFSDLRQLRVAVQSGNSRAVQERAGRASAHVRAHHSWTCRLRQLAQWI